MQENILAPPVLPQNYQLAAAWQKLFVVTGTSIFQRLTAQERKALDIPAIHGDSQPKWMRDMAQNIAVVKNDIRHERPLGVCHSVANDKIAADLAEHLKLPVLHVLIWERMYSRGRKAYFSVTPRLAPDSKRWPPLEMLLADKALPAMAVYYGYIANGDGSSPRNIIYSPGSDKPCISYLDHGLADLEGLDKYGPEGPIRSTLDSWFAWKPDIREQVRESMNPKSYTEHILTSIENMPDQLIKDTVRGVPDALFETRKSKNRVIENLQRGRECLRNHVYGSFNLA